MQKGGMFPPLPLTRTDQEGEYDGDESRRSDAGDLDAVPGQEVVQTRLGDRLSRQ